MRKILFLLAAWVGVALNATQYTFLFQPPTNTWQNAGVPGGIPPKTQAIFTTINSTNDGTDRTATINNALASAGAQFVSSGLPQVVKLGPGRFRFTTGGCQNNLSGVILRGSGCSQYSVVTNPTVIDIYTTGTANGAGVEIQNSADYNWASPASNNVVSSAVTAGTTTVTIADTTGFVTGNLFRIEAQNQMNNTAITAGAAPVIAVSAVDYVRSQIVNLVSKTSTTLTFSPGLLYDMTGLAVRCHYQSVTLTGSAIEDLDIDMTNQPLGGPSFCYYGIYMQNNKGNWVSNVRTIKPYNYGLFIVGSAFCTIERYYADSNIGSGTNGSGILFGSSFSGACSCLVYNNIIYKSLPGFEINFGSAANVFAYNATFNMDQSGFTIAGLNTNHGPHNSYNLYEGNYVPVLQCDGYKGSTSADTVFRNWISSRSTGNTGPRFPVILNRFTRSYQVVGNQLGTTGEVIGAYSLGYPLVGNDGFSSGPDVQPTAGTFWGDWPGTLVSDTTYLNRDLDVQASSTFKANWQQASGGGVPVGEAILPLTLPNSLYLASKPTWFGNLAFPAYDPYSPNFSSQAIPAGYRYANGADPASGGTVTSAMSGKATVTGKVTIK